VRTKQSGTDGSKVERRGIGQEEKNQEITNGKRGRRTLTEKLEDLEMKKMKARRVWLFWLLAGRLA